MNSIHHNQTVKFFESETIQKMINVLHNYTRTTLKDGFLVS